jgi:biopolymer transport protein ExbB
MYDVVFNSGLIGLLIWILLFATSTAAAALIIRCAWILRRKRFGSAAVLEQLMALLKVGNWDGAYAYFQVNPSVTTRIAGAVLRVAHVKNKAERQEIAVAALDKEVRAVLRQINTLSLCGNIAPMLGLLGTVTGMVDAFMGLGTAMGPEKASILAISISQALYTTAAGLLIAVPAITFATIFRNLLEKRTEDVSEAVEQILEAIPEPEAPRPGYLRTDTVKILPE